MTDFTKLYILLTGVYIAVKWDRAVTRKQKERVWAVFIAALLILSVIIGEGLP